MKKILLLSFAMFVMNCEIYTKFFWRTPHQVFYKTLQDVADHPDAKVAYLVMLGCPKLQQACLDMLHANTRQLFRVKLITDAPYDSWRYPYFSQVTGQKEAAYQSYQSALILGAQDKSLTLFAAETYFLTYRFKILDNPQDCALRKKEFDKQWEELKNLR